MLCLRCSRGLGGIARSSMLSNTAPQQSLKLVSKRTFTSLRGPSRPTIFSSFRASLAVPAPTVASPATGAILDLLPKISAHPALGATQIRCGPRNTFDPSHFVRKRRHGFLSRLKTRKGRMTLARRRAKKRSTMSH